MLPNLRLFEGDCLEVLQGISSGSVDLVLADPPYGTTRMKWDSVIPLEPLWEQLLRVLKPLGLVVMTSGQPFTTTLIASNLPMFKYSWVWEKTSASNPQHSNYQPLKVHEDILVFTRGGTASNSKTPAVYNKQMEAGKPYSRGFVTSGGGVTEGGFKGAVVQSLSGARNPRSVLKISNPKTRGRRHPTQKPLELMEYLLRTYSHEGHTVMDFAMGGGSTGAAALKLGRPFIGIEKDPVYFEVAKTFLTGLSEEREAKDVI